MKNLLNKSRFVGLRIGLIAVTILILLFMGSFSGKVQKNDTFVNNFEKIKRADAVFNESALRVKNSLSLNYDEIVQSTSNLKKLLQEQEHLYRTEYQAKVPKLENIFKKIDQALETKIRLTEKFKSSSSTIKNSLTYLQSENSRIQNAMQKSNRITNYQIFVSRFFGEIQFTFDHPDSSQREKMKESHRRLIQLLVKEHQSPELLSFKKHVDFLLDNSNTQRDFLVKILSVPTLPLTQEAQVLFEQFEKESVWRASIFQIFLFIFSLFLAAAVVLVLTRQDNTINIQTISLTQKNNDLTQSLQMLSETQAQLLQTSKLSALGEMAGGIAHEINNPLSVIVLYAEEIQESLSDQKMTHTDLFLSIQKIEATARRIGKIISGLRSFSRDASNDPIEEFTLQALVDETLAFCLERFKVNNIRFDVSPNLARIYVEGRKYQLSQVLLNLLNNAQDAIAPLKEKWISLDAQEADNIISIKITDSGNGIPEAANHKIFQPFFTTKEIGKGTGLGLSISKGIVASHHGNLQYQMKDGHTQFIIDLPRHQPNSSSKLAA